MDLTGFGAVADLANNVINHLFPDKTQAEKDAAAFQVKQMVIESDLLKGQLDINKAEAASNDPLQHWRGGLGWVCVLGYFWNFVGQPLIQTFTTLYGHPVDLAFLDISELSTLTLGMLGLGGLHATQAIMTAKK